jgi:hypothetical protein
LEENVYTAQRELSSAADTPNAANDGMSIAIYFSGS